MNLESLRTLLQDRSDLSVWLGVSMLLYFFFACLSGLLGPILRNVDGSSLRVWGDWSGWPWLLDILRWAYMIGLPYLLLVSGLLSPTQMGLTELDWVGTLRRGAVLVPAALIALLIAWWTFSRSVARQSMDSPSAREPLATDCIASVAEAAALQLHWAFYRSSAATLSGGSDLYWAAWLGAVLILLQWGLNPWVWRSLRSADGGEGAARRGVLLIVSTALFLVTGNLWLNWLVHALFECCARRMSSSVRANGEE